MPKEVATVTAVAETATVTAVAKTADVPAVGQDDGAICSGLIKAFPEERSVERAAEEAFKFLGGEMLKSFREIVTVEGISDNGTPSKDQITALMKVSDMTTHVNVPFSKTMNECLPCKTMDSIRTWVLSQPPKVLLSAEFSRPGLRFDEMAARRTLAHHLHTDALSKFVADYTQRLTNTDGPDSEGSKEGRLTEQAPAQVRTGTRAALTGSTNGTMQKPLGTLKHSGQSTNCYLCSVNADTVHAMKAELVRLLANPSIDSTAADPSMNPEPIGALHMASLLLYGTWASNQAAHTQP